MSVEHENPDKKIVAEYFDLIREMREGNVGSIPKLLNLWNEDGVFEFAGSPPVTGTYKGINAIHTLYLNRCKACGMPLKLEGANVEDNQEKEIGLGVVTTDIGKINSNEKRIVVGWKTTVGTTDGRGFEVAGSHTFTFKDEKIETLKLVVSPRPDRNEKLLMDDLSVNDIGRLALAAWAVV